MCVYVSFVHSLFAFVHLSQGMKSCPGKRQRRGKSGVLECHILDLQELDSLDIVSLRRFVTEDAEIMGRSLTGLCAKCQRQVARTIKRSRHMGIMPHIGQFHIRDCDPKSRDAHLHRRVAQSQSPRAKAEDREPLVSKTLL